LLDSLLQENEGSKMSCNHGVNDVIADDLTALRLVDLEEPDDSTFLLPPEIWIKIVSYLSPRELCDLCLVNWRFRSIALDPVLWTRINIQSDAVADTETVVNLIKSCYLLAELSLRCRDDISTILGAVAKYCKKVKRLDVRFCPILTFKDLENLSLNCRSLEHLDLECTGCLNRDRDLHEREGSTECACITSNSFASLLTKFESLSSLHLFACKNLNSQGFRQIADCCPNLEMINVDEINYLDDDSFIYFISKTRNKLKQFWLDGESLSDKSFSVFGDLQKLELLSISFADSMGSKGLKSISRLSNLEWLKIRRGSSLLASDFFLAFSENKLSKLICLDLSECSTLTDYGLMTISKNCPTLATLNLCWCWELTDTSLKLVVKSCRFIINLNLCGVVKLGGEFLRDIGKHLVGLSSLDLEQCPDIQECDLQRVLSQNINISIKDYYGEPVYPAHCELLPDYSRITLISRNHL